MGFRVDICIVVPIDRCVNDILSFAKQKLTSAHGGTSRGQLFACLLIPFEARHTSGRVLAMPRTDSPVPKSVMASGEWTRLESVNDGPGKSGVLAK